MNRNNMISTLSAKGTAMAQTQVSRRPTKVMMLAVNASIDGDTSTVDQLVKKHDLDCAELEKRIAIRNGRKYEWNGRKKGAGSKTRPISQSLDLKVTIDGRTAVAKLFRLIEQADLIKGQAQQELKRRPPEEIEPVKKAFVEVELLRREQEKIREKIRAAEEALG